MKSEPNKTRHIVPALVLPFVTCGLQWLLWNAFKPFAWFLFYPTVYFSSRIGGKQVGIVSTVVSALLVVYFFIPPQLSFAGKPLNNLISVVVFLIMGVLFSYTHDRLDQARQREAQASAAALIAEERLQEAIIGRLEAEKRLAEEKFSLAFARNPAAIAVTRLDDGLFLEVNDTWVALIGYSREEAIGNSAREMHIWPSAEDARHFIDNLRKKGTVSSKEQEFCTKQGKRCITQLASQILTIDGEQVILSTLVDITAQKQVEQELRERNSELERFNRAAIERELAMIRLKQQVNALVRKSGQPPPYDLSFIDGEAFDDTRIES